MESIVKWLQAAVLKPVPILDLAPIPAKPHGKLRLSPEQLLSIIQAQALAEWALWMTRCLRTPRLPRCPGGRPPTYPDSGILLMTVVQAARSKSYEQIMDWVATNEALALALGFTRRSPARRKVKTISKGQY